ncbi:hypothetical protein FOXYS1_5040 [Fusarium oxysporum]|uniref:Uncharacterized protein n=1 Tax=Fusarium oxysporum TaxID=5507 RepID=A0A8H5EKR1_FUSOX|nr:hypothetical protein FOXYS1_5040 [Fusarium oxysporum]
MIRALSLGLLINTNVPFSFFSDAFFQDLDAEMGPADVRARRMRCYGHILNLVACAFLYGENVEAFEAQSQVFDLLGRPEDDL